MSSLSAVELKGVAPIEICVVSEGLASAGILEIKGLFITIVIRFRNNVWLRRPVNLGCHNSKLIFTCQAASCTFIVMAGQNVIQCLLIVGF